MQSTATDDPTPHRAMTALAAPPRVEERAMTTFEREAAIRAMPPVSSDPLLQLLGTMRMGAILVAVDGQVAYLNEAAKEALQADLGLALRGDRIVAVAPDVRRRLVVVLNNACRAPYVDGAVLLGSGRGNGIAKPLRVMSMTRIGGGTQRPPHHEGLALLCVGSARQRAPDAAMLGQLFGLTGAEAMLMAGIAGGQRLHQCAAGRGVSLATVRAQLRSVFVKTGAATQADLTFIAWSIPGLWIN
jgi:DNA-binding CsgD family transcriptional regulator